MTKAFDTALVLLARREHGAEELAQKLAVKGYAQAEILMAITECQRLDLQSDLRFVESICRVRIRQGYGPERIRRELQQKQIDRTLLSQVLAAEQTDWIAHALRVMQKKYKSLALHSYVIQQKQKQFLLYRGFTVHMIEAVFEQIRVGCDELSSDE